jgi:uncharacterized membrane protein YfcA
VKEMLLVLEIGLAVAAWRRGWRGWALLPLAAVFLVGSIVGLAVGTSGGSVEDVFGTAILLDLTTIVTLAAMVAHPRAEAREHENLAAVDASEPA